MPDGLGKRHFLMDGTPPPVVISTGGARGMSLYGIKMDGEEWRYLWPSGGRLADGLRTQLSWGGMAVCLIGVGVKGQRSKVKGQRSEVKSGLCHMER